VSTGRVHRVNRRRALDSEGAKHMPKLNKASVLRDTGCTTFVVRRRLVGGEQLLENPGIIACLVVQSGEQHYSHGGY